MITKTIQLMAFVGAIMLFSNCNKQPEACVTASKKTVAIGESITFTSCSENAERSVWNFGDGSAEVEGNSASKSFSAAGNYLVELRTFSKRDKKWDRSSVLITVQGAKKRVLKRIVIESYPLFKPDGSTWDAILNTDPDIFIRMQLDSSNYTFNTSVVSDVKVNQLPLVWEYTPLRILLANSEWKIQMRDDDQIVGLGGSELMAEFVANLATAAPTAPGVIRLTQASANAIIRIEFGEE
jgi:hypothetical protein